MPNPSTTTKKQGWEKSCDCGFMLRDYNKNEFTSLVNAHIKTSHNMAPMSEAEIIKGARAIQM